MEHATPVITLLIAAFIWLLLFNIRRARQGKSVFIRRISGIDAVQEAVGRAVEQGRPISFSTGMTDVGPTLYACLGVLQHVARKAALFHTKLLVPCRNPEVLALTEATVQNAYRAERKLHRFEASDIRYLSDEQFAYASGYMGIMHRENVGSAFLLGDFAAESLILAEAGQQVGAMQIAGTTMYEQIPFFLTTCDYTLFGEELYAAGAFLSKDPTQSGSLRAQDIAKLCLFLFLIVGIIEASLGSQETQIESSLTWPWATTAEAK